MLFVYIHLHNPQHAIDENNYKICKREKEKDYNRVKETKQILFLFKKKKKTYTFIIAPTNKSDKEIPWYSVLFRKILRFLRSNCGGKWKIVLNEKKRKRKEKEKKRIIPFQ